MIINNSDNTSSCIVSYLKIAKNLSQYDLTRGGSSVIIPEGKEKIYDSRAARLVAII